MGQQFFLAKFFNPLMEDVRRETFEGSHTYNKSMVQELQNMQYQYIQADEAHKAALASIFLRRVADFNEEKLTPGLRNFTNQLRKR